MSYKNALVLFNNHLRIHDNLALKKAIEDRVTIIPVFIYLEDKEVRPFGSSHKWWLHHSLEELFQRFKQKKTQLLLRKGNLLETLQTLLQETRASHIYWNESGDPCQEKLYQKMQDWCQNNQVKAYAYPPNLLVDPQKLMTQQGEYFKVYSPFWAACLKQLCPEAPVHVESWVPAEEFRSDSLQDWNLLKNTTCSSLEKFWKPGELSAQEKLQQFLLTNLAEYDRLRDRLDLSNTSELSPHLRWGEISIREIWHILQQKKDLPRKAVDKFLQELGFREFSYYILHHFPSLGSENFRKPFDQFAWIKDKCLLDKWRKAQTGYPVVDAAMKQLQESGWVHNRGRLLAGSFLTKDLLMDWREGESWYWECLVDGDIALNPFNWQWVAGSGADGAPYFRIFNPTLQAQKFDPEGNYVKKWISQLKELDKKYIHTPWEFPLQAKGYPTPLVDHGKARERALQKFEEIKNIPGDISSR